MNRLIALAHSHKWYRLTLSPIIVILGLVLAPFVNSEENIDTMLPCAGEACNGLPLSDETNVMTVSGHIQGYDMAYYQLDIGTPQTVQIVIKTDNLSAYFNVYAENDIPGQSEALVRGSSQGHDVLFSAPQPGRYVLQVYLMRNAARRDERAQFSLSAISKNGASISD